MRLKLSVIFLVVLFALILPSKGLNAQLYNNAISANPIGLAFGQFNATYESRMSANNSFTISGYYWDLLGWNAYGFGGSYRWYLKLVQDKKTPLEGLSAGPAIAVGFWSLAGYGSDWGGASIAIGGEVAYKWVFDGFVVEPLIGLYIPVVKPNYFTGYNSFGAGVNLGYAWN